MRVMRGDVKVPIPHTPPIAADFIIQLVDHKASTDDAPKIVLIERKNEPFGWAIPGGFMDYGETIMQTAIREALEETSLDISIEHMLGVYSTPGRDPRGQALSVVFLAWADGTPKAADDAKNIGQFTIDEALAMKLTFDHNQILKDYKEYLFTGCASFYR